jgi:ADP-heptose:LPS heptosyltransferase
MEALGARPRIAVLRALQLGDMICATPALRAIKLAYPDAGLTLIGLPGAHELADRLSYIDDFVAMPGMQGLPEQQPDPAAFATFIREVREHHFDLALQMHGDGSVTNGIVQMFGARRTAGYFAEGAHCPDPKTYIAYPDWLPEPHRHLALAGWLGADATDDHLEFPVTDADYVGLDSIAGAKLGRPYAVIHPGGSSPERRWEPENFAAVAESLWEAGYCVVLTGVAIESEMTALVQQGSAAPLVDLTGRTSLGTLGALVEQADLVVCNDTGVSHVAAALDTPSVVIGRNSDALRWAPVDMYLHRYLADNAGSPVMAGEVLRQAFDLLARTAERIEAAV